MQGGTSMKAKGYSTIAGLEKLSPEEIKAAQPGDLWLQDKELP
jgi:hypothetical protein